VTQQLTTGEGPLKEFYERLAAKLRDDIGGMLPDEVLNQLVAKAVEEEFFKPRTVRVGGHYSTVTEERPSWFVEEVGKAAKPLVEAMVKDYVAEHTDEIKKAGAEFRSPQNLLPLTFAAMRTATYSDLADLANQIVTRMRQNY